MNSQGLLYDLTTVLSSVTVLLSLFAFIMQATAGHWQKWHQLTSQHLKLNITRLATHAFVMGVKQGLLPNFLTFSQGKSDARRSTPAPSIICHPQQQQPAAPPHLAPRGSLSPTSDALIGHSPRGRPRRRGMTLARGSCRRTGIECGTLSDFIKKRERIKNKRNSADHYTSLSSLFINI